MLQVLSKGEEKKLKEEKADLDTKAVSKGFQRVFSNSRV